MSKIVELINVFALLSLLAVGGGTAKEVFVFGELGFDVIQRDRANDKNGHRRRTMGSRPSLIQKKQEPVPQGWRRIFLVTECGCGIMV
jgi:hypothetical protein